MKLRKGPRPWPIRVFAILFAAVGVYAFVGSLMMIDEARATLDAQLSTVEVSRDMAIVIVCARLSVVAITLSLVWFLAAPFARWLLGFVGVVTLLRVIASVQTLAAVDFTTIVGMGPKLVGLIAIGCLFLPEGRLWFRPLKERHAQAFE